MRIAQLILPTAAALVLAGHGAAAKAGEKGYTAKLTGAEEVPGPGDPDGSGSASVTIDSAGKVCVDLKVDAIAPATAAHIHRGAAGVAGPPVVTLQAPSGGASKGCIDTSAEVIAEIKANPAGFYVNVHNPEHPPGAIRGQLTQ